MNSLVSSWSSFLGAGGFMGAVGIIRFVSSHEDFDFSAVLFFIHYPRHLLGLLSILAHNRKFAGALLAVPDHPFVAEAFGDANFSQVPRNLIRRHNSSPGRCH